MTRMAISKVDANSTVQQAREFVGERLEEGVRCPCCGQHAERYRRRVSAAMVKTMGRMLVAGESAPTGMVHLPDIKQESRDVATCAYFDLIQREGGSAGRTGYWRVTDLGRRFLEGKVSVPKYAFVYNGEVRGFSDEAVTVDGVAPKFSMTEIREEVR